MLRKADLACDGDLICRDAAFEEIGEFLNILKVHEREGFFAQYIFGIPSIAYRWSAMNSSTAAIKALWRKVFCIINDNP